MGLQNVRKVVAALSIAGMLVLGTSPAFAEEPSMKQQSAAPPPAAATSSQGTQAPADSAMQSDASAPVESPTAGADANDTAQPPAPPAEPPAETPPEPPAPPVPPTEPPADTPAPPDSGQEPAVPQGSDGGESGEGEDGAPAPGDELVEGEEGLEATGDDAPEDADEVGTEEDDGGAVVMRVPNPSNGGAVINVKISTLRGGGTAATAGIEYQLYTNSNDSFGSPVAGDWARCTTDADGDCSFEVPSNRLNTRYWVVPAVMNGSNSFMSDALVTGNNTPTGSERFAYTPYVFRTQTVQAGQTYNVPGSGVDMPTNTRIGDPGPSLTFTGATANRWSRYQSTTAASLYNNRYVPTCNVGLRVALIVDLSTSMVMPNQTGLNGVREASQAFATAFQDKGVTLGVYTFGSNANGALVSPTVVTGSNINGIRSTLAAMNVSGTQYTNWDRGFEQVAGQGYDLVVVLTDGNPTRYRNGADNNAWTDMRGIEEAIFSANLLKSQGTQILAFGVGAYLDAAKPQNLRAVTGGVAWGPGGNIANSDYAITSNWNTVSQQLGVLAATLNCEATVQVQKQVRATNGELSAASGWEFTPVKTGSGTMTPAGAQTTTGTGYLPTPWSIKFTGLNDTANLQITEANTSGDYEVESVTCTNGGVQMAPIAAGETFTLSGLTRGDSIVCVVINAEVERTATMSVDKIWVVQDNFGNTIFDTRLGTGTLPAGISAALQLTGGTPPGNLGGPDWGDTVEDLLEGDVVNISESTSIQGLPGCVEVSRTMTWANGDVNTPLPESGVDVTLAIGHNEYEITNVVECETTIVVLKTIEGGGSGTPADWNLTVTDSTDPQDVRSVTGADTASAANTLPVVADRPYALDEEIAASGTNLAYVFDRLEVCTAATDTTCDTWATVDPAQLVQVPLGQQQMYRFVNALAPSIQVPLTGGTSSDLYAGLGLSITVIAALLATSIWRNTRRQERKLS